MTVLTVIGAILVFSVIIFVHEWGHFITARLCGVTVEEFAIGMGPALFKKQGKKTLYSLRAVPMGGFCKMKGEDEEDLEEGSFSAQGPWARALILVAGATMNILLGFLIVLLITSVSAAKYDYVAVPTVSEVMEDSALHGVLQEGDRIVAVGEDRVHIVRDLDFYLSQNGEKETTLTIKRGNEKLTVPFSPMLQEEDGYKRYLIGFYTTPAPPTVGNVLHEAWYQTIWMGKLVIESLKMLVTGQVGMSDISGPVGVVSVMQETAKQGLLNFLFLAAFLAVNIGMMNLLPIPALDGGRLLFVMIELIFRKPVPSDKEGWVHGIGMILLLALMAYVTIWDVVKLF